jgi:hypothetical protein
MGVWRPARERDWELILGISALILAFLVIGALFAYQGHIVAGR